MADGPRFSEQQITERRSERRLQIDARVQGAKDWVSSLDDAVSSGKMTPIERVELIARSMVARDVLTDRANERSRKDAMTGLLNKGAFIEEYSKILESGAPFGLMILDIDHFKKVNDTYGHKVGDSVLIQTAENIKSNLRTERPEGENDKIFRYGGEEMVVIFPQMHTEDDLMMVSERLRKSIETTPYHVHSALEELHIPITVSIGGGIFRPDTDYRNNDGNSTTNGIGQFKDQGFFEIVDKSALYEAKQSGRNKTVIVKS